MKKLRLVIVLLFAAMLATLLGGGGSSAETPSTTVVAPANSLPPQVANPRPPIDPATIKPGSVQQQKDAIAKQSTTSSFSTLAAGDTAACMSSDVWICNDAAHQSNPPMLNYYIYNKDAYSSRWNLGINSVGYNSLYQSLLPQFWYYGHAATNQAFTQQSVFVGKGACLQWERFARGTPDWQPFNRKEASGVFGGNPYQDSYFVVQRSRDYNINPFPCPNGWPG